MKTTNQNNVMDELNITLKDVQLEGFLRIPKDAKGVVIFAHGSGSSRFSHRNQAVADYLFQRNMGTLLFDLLTDDEEERDQLSAVYRFNISFLAERLGEVADWLVKKFKAEKINVPIGFFGASTGAAAAIEAAVRRPDVIKVIVSRGGRPDLATLALPKLKVPILLIVGEKDSDVLRLNQEAFHFIHTPKKICVVKGATHLFEEPGALEEAAHAAACWFERYFNVDLIHVREGRQRR